MKSISRDDIGIRRNMHAPLSSMGYGSRPTANAFAGLDAHIEQWKRRGQ
jgi:hypothetical protein